MAKAKRPKDLNQRAKNIVDIATGEIKNEVKQSEVKTAAQLLGREGGLKGGIARAKKLTQEERTKIARDAARKRWGHKED